MRWNKFKLDQVRFWPDNKALKMVLIVCHWVCLLEESVGAPAEEFVRQNQS